MGTDTQCRRHWHDQPAGTGRPKYRVCPSIRCTTNLRPKYRVNIVSVPLFASVTPGADQPGHMLCLSLYLRRRHETAPNRTKQPSETSDLIQQGVFSPVQRP